MGFDRRQDPGARPGAQPGEVSPGPGKQTRVAAELESAAGEAALDPGKQTRVNAELETVTLEDGTLQRKAAAAGAAGAGAPSAGSCTPLPPDVRARMEAALGANFAAVRVHQDAYAQAIGAQAFTRGTDIFFAPGGSIPAARRGLS
jgi:hypothetical protein